MLTIFDHFLEWQIGPNLNIALCVRKYNFSKSLFLSGVYESLGLEREVRIVP